MENMSGEDIMSNFLDYMAASIDSAIQDVFHTRMGFVVLMFPFGETDRPVQKAEGEVGANYVSNADQEDMIKFLRETADRLESRKTIGKPIGTA